MTGMLRGRKARQAHGMECSWGCCKSSTPAKSYRTQEKREVARDIEKEIR